MEVRVGIGTGFEARGEGRERLWRGGEQRKEAIRGAQRYCGYALMGYFSCDGVQYVCEDNVHVFQSGIHCILCSITAPSPPSGEPVAQSSGRGIRGRK